MAKTKNGDLLERVDRLERELEQLKRDLLQQLSAGVAPHHARKASLFGSVQGGDITEQMIEESKKHLFRLIEDL